jgi:HNH endonuclease
MTFGAINNEVVGSHTKDEWERLLAAQGFLCFYCGRPICKNSTDPSLEATKDHLLAQSRRGVDFIWNVVGACLQCNRLKGQKLPGEFLRERWAFARAVDATAKRSTDIPLSKGRDKSRSYVDDEEEQQGIYIKAHMKVCDSTAQMLRYLAKERKMPSVTEDGYWQQRRQLLAQQAQSIGRLFLEAAGQLQLCFDMPSSVKKPMETIETTREAATLTVSKGMIL